MCVLYSIGQGGNRLATSIAGITSIGWTVYGKIKSITKAGGTISYTYDAAGNRISKTVGTKTTVYVRDATGNVMSVYETLGTGYPMQTEVHLYGSSRLGIMTPHYEPIPAKSVIPGYGTAAITTFTRGEKIFELANHLGNVLTTISDKRLPVSTSGTSLDYYTADVISATDYAPFGMGMVGRSVSSDKYRYGFNGKENDNEVKGVGNQQDYSARIYDPRLGRFLSTDPLTKKFPELTPYQFASNRAIDGVDLDGLEYATFTIFVKNGKVLDIKHTTDYELKNKNTQGPGVRYDFKYANKEGIFIGIQKTTWSKNMYGIYQGSDNPKLPHIGDIPTKTYDNYDLKPIDYEDAAALVHDLTYDHLYPKQEGLSGVMDLSTTPANLKASVAAFGTIFNGIVGNEDKITKKPVTRASVVGGFKIGFGFATAEALKVKANIQAAELTAGVSRAIKTIEGLEDFFQNVKDKTNSGVSSVTKMVTNLAPH